MTPLPESDQQQLQDGQSLAPFLSHTNRVDHRPAVRRQIRREVRTVQRFVLARRENDLTQAPEPESSTAPDWA